MIQRISGRIDALVRVPEGSAPAGGWPLLCFLHGYEEGAPVPIDEGVVRHGPLRRENPPESLEQFLILAPQLPMKGDLWMRYGDHVLELVCRVHEDREVDSSRRYLTGFSFGGNGVFDLAAAHADTWTALWAVDPTRVPETDPGLPVWLSAGNLARRIRESLVERLRLASEPDLSASRVWLDEGEDHVGSARRAFGDRRIYEWLLQWKRSEADAETVASGS